MTGETRPSHYATGKSLMTDDTELSHHACVSVNL